ncbi:MAG: hypothetical protein A3I07_03725 [Candidatus Doudnabacteria bacterium RIFCSPLOWO2_02_FULL_42_9]|uniref:Uncharacterized protein n=1 Tax=Candidatus Doudnabacteria bacterium RIFCSPHIGHO2_01_FULL_41_86 TaxID=1817821 RepID=A0A1F5N8Z8_9BACT|nr:MAG: hypothetical protein A2717_00580 [Candidatus Doudnabacteria bacterium RIFCSPHIGHO2_01_FULL_41_86]OGE86438.1 MAG: hypothetical protein A3E28_00455 [Candidatus Doudnabacteria bacterium RIFCSPHIGHO2_12_FULL_42_22]OGE87437.1 MAG: hypothetical protein A3C49_04440 [Candidatus Doudnabacteria bacterium RIFCSPHIGHO2_02_FULL_42_25]OGE92735.1 MAG: hypothetical protein A2895_03935 [Candidatus Doudnabacteria bacterium RIFCSPLOWO2_01_FULL_42_60]OGE99249.1 MAG: hypothetical protein A3G89_03435 [Candid
MLPTRIKVLWLTAAEIIAMAAGKPSGVFWGVVTHTSPHLDELWGVFQLRHWGEHRFPGICSPDFVLVLLMDPDSITWQELSALGLIPVGIGGKENPFDEHGLVDEDGERVETCAAMLIERGHRPRYKKDPGGYKAWFQDAMKRGLDLLNRVKFFRRLYPNAQVYIHAIDTITKYVRQGDLNRTEDKHAAGNDVKDRWSVYEDLARKKLRLPKDMTPLAEFIPKDEREALNVLGTRVVNDTFRDLWLYLARGISFADCIRRVKDNPPEKRKFYIEGIKPPMWLKIIREHHPLANLREVPPVLRHLGADWTYKRNASGHIHIGFPDYVIKIVEEDEIDSEMTTTEEEYVSRTRIKVKFFIQNVLRALRRLEKVKFGKNWTEEEMGRPQLEGSLFSTPNLEAGFILWGSTFAGQGTIACPFEDDDLIQLLIDNIEGEIVESRELHHAKKLAREEDEVRQQIAITAVTSLADMPVDVTVG